MPASIGGQLHTYVEARLGRWAVWYRWGARPGPRPVRSWFGAILDHNVEQIGGVSTSCPVDINEALETNRAVMALSGELREAVFEGYLKGGSVEQKCRALGLRSRQSYYDRLNRAYGLVLGYLNDLAAGVPLPAIEPSRPVRARRIKIA